MANDTHDKVKEYYGKVLAGKNDLQTSACCEATAPPAHIRAILEQVPDEVLDKFYGCGSPIPPEIEGCRVLDLGSGTGRDVFICAALAGEDGHVTGIDMTDEQLEVARRNTDLQMKRFGFSKSNVTFVKGYMEDLAAVGIEDNSIDVVTSNCVINLSPNKGKVFEEIFRVLKPGGELLFSDVFADRRLPQALMADQMLVGECLAGAIYLEDFRRMMLDLGLRDYRMTSSRPITPDNPEIVDKTGLAEFMSITIRAFKLDSLEDLCEDYGQVGTYLGTIANHKNAFALDDRHLFETGKPMLVCGNTAAMISETRLGRHFRVDGNRNVHYGIFSGGPEADDPCGSDEPGGCCC
jgi:arsenite methyltransferase